MLVGRIKRSVCLSWRLCELILILIVMVVVLVSSGMEGKRKSFVMAQAVDAELGLEILSLVVRPVVDSASSGLTLGQPSSSRSDLGRVCIVDY